MWQVKIKGLKRKQNINKNNIEYMCVDSIANELTSTSM